MIYLNGLTQFTLEMTNAYMTFGLILLPGMMSRDALGLGNCQIKRNSSAEFMMQSLSIAGHIQDQGNMLRKLDVRDLIGDNFCV